MSEDQPTEPRSGHPWTWWALWVFFIVFIIYPLSAGPVWRLALAFDNALFWSCVRTFYTPLGYVYMHSPAAEQVFDWYLQLWADK